MAREVRSIDSREKVFFTNGTVVEALGLSGEIIQWRGATDGLRAAMVPGESDSSPHFVRALADVGMRIEETLHVTIRQGRGSVGTRMPAADQIVLRPAIRDGTAGVVLYQDESGGISWHFPDGHFGAKTGRRSAYGATFTISTRTPAARRAFLGAAPAARVRGPITKIGRKVFKVLVVPLSKALADPLDEIVGRIERRHRQNLVRSVAPDDYNIRRREPFADWHTLSGKRSLLIVHGIFSTTEGMLGGLPRTAMQALWDYYEGRIIAYDQLTVTKSPEENARWFLETAAQGAQGSPLIFDVLCHSRGGIVARSLVERGKILLPQTNCSFEKVFFVATPNQGSPLGDSDHVVDMLDVFTNLLTNFPDGPVAYSLEILLSIVKLVTYTATATLPGIEALGTTGYVSRVLNKSDQKASAVYAAAASDYVPDPKRDNGFFNGRFADIAIDAMFSQQPNDLVVPFSGVFDGNGHPSFPIANPLLFGPQDHVWHTDFFCREPVIERLLAFFADDVVISAGGSNRKIEIASDVRALQGLVGSRLRVRNRLKARRARGVRHPGIIDRRLMGQHAIIVERQPRIDFYDRVVEGEAKLLRVSLAEAIASGAVGNIAVDLFRDEDAVALAVSLYAPGFDVKPLEQVLTVHRTRRPSTENVTFQLAARNPGPKARSREIIAEFWHRGLSIGTVTCTTEVVPRSSAAPVAAPYSQSAPFTVETVPRQECDLIIRVEGENESGEPPFRIRLRIPAEGLEVLDCGTLKFPGRSLQDYFATAVDAALRETVGDFDTSDAEAGTQAAQSNVTVVRRLNDLGKQLWTMLPNEFRQKYFAMRQNGPTIRSIMIHSDEMIFPWELVIPHDFKQSIRFRALGIEHIIGRWKPGRRLRPIPQNMKVDQFVLVRPVYDEPNHLRWAEGEEAELIKLFRGIEVLRPADDNSFRARLLERTDVRLLHFSGHGDFNSANADLSRLLLEKSSWIDVLGLANTPLGARSNPLVYLNACGVGSTGMTVGRTGGFANACIDGGYAGLLAAYWAINDESAARISIALYQKLVDGAAIGEALRELRDHNPDDPAFLAFAYYGDPWTRLDFSSVRRRQTKTRSVRMGARDTTLTAP